MSDVEVWRNDKRSWLMTNWAACMHDAPQTPQGEPILEPKASPYGGGGK